MPIATIAFFIITYYFIRQKKKLLSIIKFSNSDLDLNEIYCKIRSILENSSVRRLVLDGIFSAIEKREQKRGFLTAVANLCKYYGVTAVWTMSEYSEEIVSVVDGLFLLGFVKSENCIQKTIRIVKLRGGSHDNSLRKYLITDKGVIVGSIFEGNESRQARPGLRELDISLMLNYGNDIKFNEFLDLELKKNFPDTKIYFNDRLPAGIEDSFPKEPNNIGVGAISTLDIREAAKQGRLLDLTEYFGENEKDYVDFAFKECVIDGKLYAVPQSIKCFVLFYRKDILEKYGFKVPVTWKELAEQSRVILNGEKNKKLNGVLMHNTPESEHTFQNFVNILWSSGGDIYDKNGEVILGNEKGLSTLQFVYDMIYKYKVSPLPGSEEAICPGRSFAEGKGLFLCHASSEYVGMLHTANFDVRNKVGFKMFPPLKINESNGCVGLVKALAIPKAAKNQNLSVEILRFTSSFNIVKKSQLFSDGWPFVARKDIFKDSEVLKMHPWNKNSEEILSSARPIDALKNCNDLMRIFNKKLFSVFTEDISIEKIMNNIAREIRKQPSVNHESKVVEFVVNYLRDNYNQPLTINDIARAANMSGGYICSLFKNHGKKTVFDHLTEIRIEKAKEMLSDVRYNIGEIGQLVGYPDNKYFGNVFKKHTGATPGQYRKSLF